MSDPWAVPGSTPADAPIAPVPPAAAPPTPGARSRGDAGRSGAPGPGGLPAPFRPLTQLEALDGGFEAVRRAPVALLGAAAVVVVPYAIVTAWLTRDLLGESFGSLTNPALATEAEGNSTDAVTVLQLTVGPLVHVLAAAGVARIVAGWYAGAVVPLGAALAWVARRSWALIVVWLCVRVLQGVGVLVACVGLLVAMTFCLVAVPAMAAEDLGPFPALRRSFRLVRPRFWPSMGFAIVSGLVASLVGLALSLLPETIAFAVDAEALWVMMAAANVATSTLTTAFVAAATTIWYVDLRVRNEGMDLVAELRSEGP
jgi:hypothetical protein